MKRARLELDESATFVGILLGIVLGGFCALLRIGKRGSIRRKDLARFGAGTAELEMEASIAEAKARAKSRLAHDG